MDGRRLLHRPVRRVPPGRPGDRARHDGPVHAHVEGAGLRGHGGTTRVLRFGEWVGPVERAVFSAPVGTTVGPITDPLGTHVVHVEAEAVAEAPTRRLGSARRRAFVAWLDAERARHVRLAPGYEHPGDPGQPDNTHRHRPPLG